MAVLRTSASALLKSCICLLDNCLDRHVEQSPDRVALIWEKDEPQQHEKITYKYTLSLHLLLFLLILLLLLGSCWR